jgi:hypothetical protein
MERGRKSSWDGEQCIVHKKMRESEEGKNKDKEIVMMS